MDTQLKLKLPEMLSDLKVLPLSLYVEIIREMLPQSLYVEKQNRVTKPSNVGLITHTGHRKKFISLLNK